MQIVMCDDDARVLVQLEKYLREYFRKKSLPQPEYQAFASGDKLLESGCEADIAFLDVEMPGMSGIHVGQRLMENNRRIMIFILTAYQDYLDEAMNLRVYRYLSKPLDKSRLFRNMNQALQNYSKINKKIPIGTKKGTIICATDEIVCVEAISGKVLVHTVNQTYESVKNMAFWNDTLDGSSFYCSYRSFIVNLKYVSSYDTNSIHLLCENGKEYTAYLSRRKAKNFEKAHMAYLGEIND